MAKIHHGGNIEEAVALTGLIPSQIIDFSANINPLGIPTKLQEVMVNALQGASRYPDPTYRELKRIIAKHYHVKPTAVLVSNGGAQMLADVIQALQPEGAVVLAPCFGEYEQILTKNDVLVDHFSLLPENDFRLDVALLIERLKDNPDWKMICLANPNNPTGQLISLADLRTLLDFCNASHRWLLLDEAFIDLTYPETPTAIPEVNRNDNVIIVHSVTKFYAIPGLRLGFAVIKNPHISEKVAEQQISWGVNTIADQVGRQMYQMTEHAQQTHHWLASELPYLTNKLKGISWLKVYPSHTNFILFKAPWNNLREVLLKQGILIRQCDDYRGLGPNYYRVAVKDRKANDHLIQALKGALEELT